MENSNLIYERRNADGTVDYIASLGTILYNDRVLTLSNMLIPLRDQTFFILPDEKDYFAAVNVYYNPDSGVFIFDVVGKSTSILQFVTADAVPNSLPIAQFIIKQSVAAFDVIIVNQYSRTATFSITDDFTQGTAGHQGPMGYTGAVGYDGAQGLTGYVGEIGYTGVQGFTGLGVVGATGLQGATGYSPDSQLLFYGKFKSDDTTLADYSIYEQDLGWGASGAGLTGVGYTGVGLGDTGTIFIPGELTSYVMEDGIIDQCHSITYRGGWSSYSFTGFIGFTGAIHAWVRVDMPPRVDFSYSIPHPEITTLRLVFTDTSMFFPTSWQWTIDDTVVTTQRSFNYLFASSGTYIVTLRATNAAGSSEKTKIVMVS